MVGCGSRVNGGYFYGRVEMDGGSYTNKRGNLLVGYGFGEGEWLQSGGNAVVCSDKTYSATPAYQKVSSEVQYATNNVFVIGCLGGKGRVQLTGGDMLSNLRVYVGGAVTNEFPLYMTYQKYYNMMPSDFTNAIYLARRGMTTGYLGVLGGNFTAAHSIMVGQDGTGVLEVGPTGTLHAASLVLTNNAYTAAGGHAAELKFTFGEDGVGTATVTNLVIGAGAALTVDMTGYVYAKTKPNRFVLVRAANVEGSFDDANVTLLVDDAKLASMAHIDQWAGGITINLNSGSAIIIR